MILSASRRTDIPAFYGEWFVNRLEEGFALVRNPLNAKMVSKLLLRPQYVECIVFWTKNATDFVKYLPKIDRLGFKYYFQYTITSYSKDIEPNVPEKKKIIENFIELSKKLGKEKTIWRYDPILLSNKYNLAYHKKYFEYLCEKISPYTEKCVISFLDDYSFLRSNLNSLDISELTENQMFEIAFEFSKIAKRYNLTLATCCEKIDLDMLQIQHNKCVDGDLIERITGLKINKRKDSGQRPLCGCIESREIGSFNTCRHKCAYCYARRGKDKSFLDFYDPYSPMLCDKLNGDEKITEVKPRLIQHFDNLLL